MNSQSSGRDVGWLRAYDRDMRHAQRVRIDARRAAAAVGRRAFARSNTIKEIAHDLRLTEGSVRR
jgi:hypothetical protein